jgi:hypothetical protein
MAEYPLSLALVESFNRDGGAFSVEWDVETLHAA